MKARLAACLGALVMVMFVVAPEPLHAQAASYIFQRLGANVIVDIDGSINVTEQLKFAFDGDFTTASRGLAPGRFDLSDVVVRESGTTLVSTVSDNLVTWTFDAANTTRTFDLSYRVGGVVDVGPDVGDFNYMIIGVDHPKIQQVDITVTSPTKDAVRSWANGPANGVVSVDGNVSRFEVSPLEELQSVQVREAIPASVFTTRPTGDDRLPTILAQQGERVPIGSAVDRFLGFIENINSHPQMLNAIALFEMIVGIGAHIVIWKRWGAVPHRDRTNWARLINLVVSLTLIQAGMKCVLHGGYCGFLDFFVALVICLRTGMMARPFQVTTLPE